MRVWPNGWRYLASFIHCTSNYRANHGGRERWPFDYTLSFNTRIINAPRSVGGSNLSSSHAMQLPLVKWLMQSQHTLPFLSFHGNPHSSNHHPFIYQDCLENSTFKSLFLTDFCHCFFLHYHNGFLYLQLTQPTCTLSLSLSLYNEFFTCILTTLQKIQNNYLPFKSLTTILFLTSWKIQNFRYNIEIT